MVERYSIRISEHRMIAADSQEGSTPIWVYEAKLACQQFKKETFD
jgi:hypothetical protein